MHKFLAILTKEFRLLKSDVVGLLLMFALPLILVLVISLIQNGAYKAISENQLAIAVYNQDEGDLGNDLVQALEKSKMFEIIYTDKIGEEMQQFLLENSKVAGLIIPTGFSSKMKLKIDQMSQQFSPTDKAQNNIEIDNSSLIEFYHDPILQENFVFSIMNAINTHLNVLQSRLILKNIYAGLNIQIESDSLVESMMNQKMPIQRMEPKLTQGKAIPKNATQHNVPAWTIFAMFFMVVSLGSNIVKEKISGSFDRIRMAPTNMYLILFGKLVTYFMVAILQIILIFTVGMFAFPFIGMEALTFPENFDVFILISALSALVAVSFAMVIGVYSKTLEQANGIGSILVVIFAALGGIWVPVFVMPELIQSISYFSPMRWCLEAYYLLFLQNASIAELSGVIVFLSIFIVVCQALTLVKLKIQNLI